MSLLDNQNYVEIKLYYRYSDVKGSKKLIILENEKAEELLKDPEKSKDIESFTTKWMDLNWREQNEVMEVSSKPVGPKGERQFSFVSYRDAIIKRCIKEWDLTLDGRPIPVSPEAIDRLPGIIVAELYQRYEKMLEYSEEELKN